MDGHGLVHVHHDEVVVTAFGAGVCCLVQLGGRFSETEYGVDPFAPGLRRDVAPIIRRVLANVRLVL